MTARPRSSPAVHARAPRTPPPPPPDITPNQIDSAGAVVALTMGRTTYYLGNGYGSLAITMAGC
jgi:hypothetical protein